MESGQPRTQGDRQPEGTRASSPGARRKRIVALTIIALAAVWLIAFILSNTETVRVSFVFGHVSVSLIWAMLICAVLGALLALAIPRLRRRS
jgi:uncharacterized integral membrane protein